MCRAGSTLRVGTCCSSSVSGRNPHPLDSTSAGPAQEGVALKSPITIYCLPVFARRAKQASSNSWLSFAWCGPCRFTRPIGAPPGMCRAIACVLWLDLDSGGVKGAECRRVMITQSCVNLPSSSSPRSPLYIFYPTLPVAMLMAAMDEEFTLASWMQQTSMSW